MEKILAVLSSERQYAERFCDYINRRDVMMLTAVPFTDIDDYKSFELNHRITLLLADSGFSDRVGEPAVAWDERRTEKTLFLSDPAPQTNTYQKNKDSKIRSGEINRYQSAERLVRTILESCSDMSLEPFSKSLGRNVRVIGVFSPARGSGCTSFAMTYAAHRSIRKRVLYINFDEFSGLEGLMNEQFTMGLSDVIYYMKQGKLTGAKLQSIIRSFKGFDYIPPVSYTDDLRVMNAEDYEELISRVLGMTYYDVLVLDLGGYLSAASELMEICDTVYVPVKNDNASLRRLDEFERYVNSSGQQGLKRKLKTVILPEFDEHESLTEHIDELLYGKMGELAAELAGTENRKGGMSDDFDIVSADEGKREDFF